MTIPPSKNFQLMYFYKPYLSPLFMNSSAEKREILLLFMTQFLEGIISVHRVADSVNVNTIYYY